MAIPLRLQNMCVFHSDNTKEYRVVLGSINLGKPEASHQTLEVVETILHEQYEETTESVHNDIGDHG